MTTPHYIFASLLLAGCVVHHTQGTTAASTEGSADPQGQPNGQASVAVSSEAPPAEPASEPVAAAPEQAELEQPPVEEIPEDEDDADTGPQRLVRLGAGAALGRPENMGPRAATAVWVWHGPGGMWRIRTTSADGPHVFRGRARAIQRGEIVSLAPARAEHADRWVARNRAVHFAFRTGPHVDGLNFRTDSDCVRFHFRQDGQPAPTVFVGAEATPVQSNRFIACREGEPPRSRRERRARRTR